MNIKCSKLKIKISIKMVSFSDEKENLEFKIIEEGGVF